MLRRKCESHLVLFAQQLGLLTAAHCTLAGVHKFDEGFVVVNFVALQCKCLS
jgi:hypothetical protein